MIDLSSPNVYIIHTKFHREMVELVLASVRKVDVMLSTDLISDSYPLRIKTTLPICFVGYKVLVQGSLFQFLIASQVFNKVFMLVSPWVHLQ